MSQPDTTWLQRFRASYRAANKGVATPDTEQELDPRTVEIIVTQGDLDNLTGRISSAENYTRELVTSHTAQIQRMQLTEAHAIRRLFNLADNVGKLLKADKVTFGEVIGNDRVRHLLSNLADSWLELVIDSFRDAIFVLTGYDTFAARNDAADSVDYWTSAMDEELKLVIDANDLSTAGN